MKLHIETEAGRWFEEEMNLSGGEEIQFFVRYGGCGNFQSGFSLGIAQKEAEEPVCETKENGVRFYIEEKDAWYLDGADLHVVYDEDKEEITYVHGSRG
jgi:uncharacterized protein YneR